MDDKFSIWWILREYDQKTWNEMYNNAGFKPDVVVSDYNETYNDSADPINQDFNYMYGLVESGSEIEDPELRKAIEDWNSNQLPPVPPTPTEYDDIIGRALILKGNSVIVAEKYKIKLNNNETINNNKLVL